LAFELSVTLFIARRQALFQRMKLNKHRLFFAIFILLQLTFALRTYPYNQTELVWLGAGVVFAVIYYRFGGVRANRHCRDEIKNGWR